MAQKRGPLKKISGEFVGLLQVVRRDKRRTDIDNRSKGVLDYCTRLGIIEDDSFCKMIPLMWVNEQHLDGHACRITIWPLDLPPEWLASFKKEGLELPRP